MALKLSIILPCYNVERYIADCLESLYAQDMSEEEYEVICVDDCSTDRTCSIVSDYEVQHSNLTLIKHKKNLNVSAARNSGLEVAKGEYIWFVDPDDLIVQGCLKKVYEVAKNNEVELLMFNYCVVDKDLSEMPQYVQCSHVFINSPLMTGQKFVMTYTPNRFSEHCIVWRCVFNRLFLAHYGLCFPVMCKAEDVSFLWIVMLNADRVVSVGASYYIYRINPYSLANKMLEAHVVFSDRILRASRIVDMIEDKGLHIAIPIVDDMWRALRWCVNSTVQVLCNLPIDERANYYSEIISHKEDVKKVVPYMNRKNRLIFSTSMGKCVWMKKVQVICYREGRRIRK